MNTNAIDNLAESVWRRVMAWDDHDISQGHRDCPTSDPDECGLFREIHDEITSWAKAQVKA